MFENELDLLYEKIPQAGKNRLDAHGNVQLNGDWHVPANAILSYEEVLDEHKILMAAQSFCQKFSSRARKAGHVYSSPYYWKRAMDTTQDCVYRVMESHVMAE
ncbi:hypothetical protein Q1695_009282 [Nippostrongylus brasiliensis]|nr:hypothetical protein Q1695_009282 [Nippostrongylus brasiliensis]